MLQRYVKVFLFISSYTPLFCILLVKDLNVAALSLPRSLEQMESGLLYLIHHPGTQLKLVFLHPTVAYAMIVGLVIADGLHWLAFRTVRKFQRKTLLVKGVESRNGEALNYLATYVIPFLGVDLGSVRDLVSLILVFAVMATLYIRANLLHTNPVLSQLGFSIYEVSTGSDDRVVLITKTRVKPGTAVRVVHFNDNIYLEGE